MEEKWYMVSVPYEDFVAGIKAQHDLELIKKFLISGAAYASSELYEILGIEKEDTNND